MVTYRARTPSSGIRRRAWAKSACVSRHSAPAGPSLESWVRPKTACKLRTSSDCATCRCKQDPSVQAALQMDLGAACPAKQVARVFAPAPLRVRPQLLREDTAALPPLVRRRWHGAYPQWRQGAYALWSSFTIERSTSLTAWRRARGVSRGTTRCHNHTTRCCLVSHFSSRLTGAKITCLTLSLFRSRMRDALGLHIDVFP